MSLRNRLIFALVIVSLVCPSKALDYFPSGYFDSTDVTTVRWAQAVNSLAELERSLQSDWVQMLEADLAIGTVFGSAHNDTPTVILACPPANQSDLSFRWFLYQVIGFNKNLPKEKRKGIKLDIKQGPAAEMALTLLHEQYQINPQSLQFPTWINSVILKGPVNASFADIPIGGLDLIKMQKELLPHSTLSLGWTTKLEEIEQKAEGNYSREQMEEMSGLINVMFASESERDLARVTFPVRATLALNSELSLKYLLEESGIEFASPSLTLWEESTDPRVTIDELDKFIQVMGKDSVFVDLPHSFPNGVPSDSGSRTSIINSFLTSICIAVAIILRT